MKLRVVATVLLLILLIVAALILAPGQKLLAEPPLGVTIEQALPAR